MPLIEFDRLSALFQAGLYAEMESRAQALLRQYKRSGEVWKALGVALQYQGKNALQALQKTAELLPNDAEAHYNCGVALQQMNRPDEALASYDQVIALQPNHAVAHNNRGVVLGEIKRFDEALASYERAIALKPDYAEAYFNRGIALGKLERLDEARAAFNRAIELKPNYAEAHNNLGVLLAEAGQFAEAKDRYQMAIDLKPDFSACYLNRGALKKYDPDDPDLPALRRILDSAASDNDKICAGFALAKACDDLKAYDEAFALYAEANRRQKSQLGYNINRDRQNFERIQALFERLPVATPVPHHGPTPILIVGMPRSGTTLVEQILASHSEVFGAGELLTLNSLVEHEFDAGTVARDLPAASRKIASDYVAELERLSQGCRFVCDKMPLNFRWLGFLLLVLPNVKVVRMSRNPVAVCWSNFKHRFTFEGLGFACDLADLAEYHQMYEGLIHFWEARFPGRIYVLNYERLTQHQEQETRDLLAYCGLAWQDRCMEFDQLERAVHTASMLQVRRKIYQGSSETWRRYERHLGLLLEVLQAR